MQGILQMQLSVKALAKYNKKTSISLSFQYMFVACFQNLHDIAYNFFSIRPSSKESPQNALSELGLARIKVIKNITWAVYWGFWTTNEWENLAIFVL